MKGGEERSAVGPANLSGSTSSTRRVSTLDGRGAKVVSSGVAGLVAGGRGKAGRKKQRRQERRQRRRNRRLQLQCANIAGMPVLSFQRPSASSSSFLVADSCCCRGVRMCVGIGGSGSPRALGGDG